MKVITFLFFFSQHHLVNYLTDDFFNINSNNLLVKLTRQIEVTNIKLVFHFHSHM